MTSSAPTAAALPRRSVLSARPLRVCVVAPPSLRIPPFHGYGGSQRGIHDLCHVLSSRGHEVTLCGPGDSEADVARLIAPLAHPIWEDDSPYPRAERDALTERYVTELVERLGRERFDVINVRFDHHLLIQRLVEDGRAPVLYSCHNPASERFIRTCREFAGRLYTNAHCESHRAQYAGVADMHVVPYGMDVGSYAFRPTAATGWSAPPTHPALRALRDAGRDWLAWIGRIAPSKGTAQAIAIARAAGRPLVIAGAPENRHNPTVEYFEREVMPHVDGREVVYVGTAGEALKQEILGGACATLFTSGLERPDWSEPFGRVLMESLACGTPLVAHAHGSAPEILSREVAVFGHDASQLAAGVAEALRIDRGRCRRYAETEFARERMGEAYEALYRRIIGGFSGRTRA